MNEDLHKKCADYLQTLVAQHSQLPQCDTGAELAFFQNMTESLSQLVQYIQLAQSYEEQLKKMMSQMANVGANIDPMFVPGFSANPAANIAAMSAQTHPKSPARDESSGGSADGPGTGTAGAADGAGANDINDGSAAVPRANDEAAPAAEPTDEQPKYTLEQLQLLNTKYSRWSRKKRIAVNEHPDVHPDDILDTGERKACYWTWDEVIYLNEACKTMDLEQLTRAFPEHTEHDILSKASRLNISLNVCTKGADEIETYLPESMREPEIGARIKAFRLNKGMSVGDLSVKSGIAMPMIHKLEHGTVTPTPTQTTGLSNAFELTSYELCEQPIGELLPFDPLASPNERIRTARVRCGLTMDVLCTQTRININTLRRYETSAAAIKTTDFQSISRVTGVPIWVFLAATPPGKADTKPMPTPAKKPAETPAKKPAEPPVETPKPAPTRTAASKQTPALTAVSIGELIQKERIRKGMSQQELALKAGISPSHVSSIEHHRSLPSEEAKINIAKALGVSVYQIDGTNKKQPHSYFMQRSARNNDASNTVAEQSVESLRARGPGRPAGPSKRARDFADAVIAARSELGISQEELARRINLGVQYVKDVETNGLTYTNGFMSRKISVELGIDLESYKE